MAEIALFGANGTIGSRILREALDRGHRVTAVVRDPAKLIAGTSLGAWCAVLICGRLLTFYRPPWFH
jgi:uncharacterized protein YbjT (DUF2867 family)